MKHYNIKVRGKVQGVFFREGTKAVADQLGVKGLIRNETDGSVYIEVEGEDWLLENFLEWCSEGPDRAQVESVEKEESEIVGFDNFIVKK